MTRTTWRSEPPRLPPPPRNGMVSLHILVLLNMAAYVIGTLAIVWAILHVIQPVLVPGACGA